MIKETTIRKRVISSLGCRPIDTILNFGVAATIANGVAVKLVIDKSKDGLSGDEFIGLIFAFIVLNVLLLIVLGNMWLHKRASMTMLGPFKHNFIYACGKLIFSFFISALIFPVLLFLGCGVWVSAFLAFGLAFVMLDVGQGIIVGAVAKKTVDE